ncbi:hypothetical protein M0638_12555 [Roseomonas sp. NAR14]|uniref:Uncharacterized protein n=1 Tax=Roseomonas acroporae TaxID=2937791 RepID=A0A9X2BVN3_9PROT|nr:hypothetical protein [Roseomonas acroporae]MCK8785216.1 hypothetical protein [Roseomonas acroporae]
MALDLKNLSQVAYGNGNAIWLYKTADAKATVVAAGYFNSAQPTLNQGDVIFARMSVGGSETGSILRVTAAAVGGVTVAATDLT